MRGVRDARAVPRARPRHAPVVRRPDPRSATLSVPRCSRSTSSTASSAAPRTSGYQVPKVTLFPRTYHYRSRFTADVLSGLDDLVASVEARLGTLTDRTVLDVGCNDGSLLDKFAAKGAATVGVEPTGAYEDALGRGHAIFNDFFSEDSARKIRQQHPRIDVITFTNVFAHIEDLPALLRALAVVMDEDTILVVENHYLGAVLATNQFDTFYHEHPRTYSLTSFVHIAGSLGRAVAAVEFPSRYGGNIRVTIGKDGKASGASVDDTLQREAGFFDEFAAMRSFVASWTPREAGGDPGAGGRRRPAAGEGVPGTRGDPGCVARVVRERSSSASTRSRARSRSATTFPAPASPSARTRSCSAASRAPTRS